MPDGIAQADHLFSLVYTSELLPKLVFSQFIKIQLSQEGSPGLSRGIIFPRYLAMYLKSAFVMSGHQETSVWVTQGGS